MGKKQFPLRLAPAPGGWHMVIALENGESNRLLKPGYKEETTQPYLFASQQEAWDFVKQLFYFCIRQSNMQSIAPDNIFNCKQCGRIFRANFFDHCSPCMQGNEFMLQQIWQGFYHMTGSEESAMQKVSQLLKIPEEDFAKIPTGYRTIVQRQLELYTEIENRKNSPAQKLGKMIKANPSGLHLSRRN